MMHEHHELHEQQQQQAKTWGVNDGDGTGSSSIHQQACWQSAVFLSYRFFFFLSVLKLECAAIYYNYSLEMKETSPQADLDPSRV